MKVEIERMPSSMPGRGDVLRISEGPNGPSLYLFHHPSVAEGDRLHIVTVPTDGSTACMSLTVEQVRQVADFLAKAAS